MPNLIDMAGLTFGRLTVVERSSIDPRKRWLCRCECGVEKLIPRTALVTRRTVSCGCSRRERAIKMTTKHGHHRSSTWNSWYSMVRRCTSPTASHYECYGGRGISIAPEWLEFEQFLLDMGPRPIGMSLERKDVNGNYGPSNCTWIPVAEQMANRRNNIRVEVGGRKMALSQACRMLGISYSRTQGRMQRLGWSFEKAISEPKKLNGAAYAPRSAKQEA